MRRRTLIAFGSVLALGVPALSSAAARTEEPKFEVVARHDGFEVRKYAPRIVAEVVVKGEAKVATNAGFRLLADFIFGNNTAGEEVAMTAPVDRSEQIAMTAPVDRTQSDGRWTVTFTMPSKYTMETLPRPNDDRVKIREVPPTRYAAARFSGRPKPAEVQRRIKALEEAVAAEGYTLKGTPAVYSQYNPPWTPSFLRRNEVMFELAPKSPA
jgi:effector-binding domain-containing protein